MERCPPGQCYCEKNINRLTNYLQRCSIHLKDKIPTLLAVKIAKSITGSEGTGIVTAFTTEW
jgi:hypothetical protein